MRVDIMRNSIRKLLNLPLGRKQTYAFDRTPLERAFAHVFQPLFFFAFLMLALLNAGSPEAQMGITIAAAASLTFIERLFPKREDWRPTVGNTIEEVLVFTAVTFVVWDPLVRGAYTEYVTPHFDGLRKILGLGTFWPNEWSLIARVLLAWLLGDFVWYWLHRAEHEIPGVWKASGHIVHHSPKKLGALTTFVNHPIEFPILYFTSIFVPGLFGAGLEEMMALATLQSVQSFCAHSNLALKPIPVFHWLFSSPEYHHRHHSPTLEENNSNYGCYIIIFDRLFGTFVHETKQLPAGIGPNEIPLVDKFLLPVKVPVEVQQQRSGI
jgi:sterol desaturase/sphingolipid hydroxylase (fatty acid hydroxylase superfamily)